MRGPVILAMVSTLLLAGCTSQGLGPGEGEGGIGQVTGIDEPTYQLTLRVTDEPGGPPLEGARVLVTWGSDARIDLYPEAPQVEHAVPGLGLPPETPTPQGGGYVEEATGADGTAVLTLPADRPVGIVVTKPDHTREWIPEAITGPASGSGELTVPLYQRELDIVIAEAWGPAAVSTHHVGGGAASWHPNEVLWGRNAEAQEGYIDRLVFMAAELTWTNGPTGSGDLAIGLGESPDADPILVVDEQEHQYDPGEASESFAATRWDAMDAGVHKLDGLYMGAATNGAMAAPLGLPYELAVHATFDPNPPEPVYTPMPGAGVVALLLAGLGGAVARCWR